MATLISFGLFTALMAAITYFGYRRYARPGRLYEQLGGQTTLAMPALDGSSATEPGLAVRVMMLVGERVPMNPDDAAMIQRDLIAAGYRDPNARFIYAGARILACGGLLLLAMTIRPLVTPSPVLAVVFPLFGGLIGYFGASLVLDRMILARQERIRQGLPDALDLLVVAVEAGLGLDQAIQYVGNELIGSHPDISEELQLVNLEIRAGKRRTEALHNLADRTNEGELRKLSAILIQTERFGTSIADSLRTHSDFMRVRRRQDAEERAGKVGVKLVFPIFFLILPSIMVVAAGPGLLQVFKYLFPLMKNAANPLQ